MNAPLLTGGFADPARDSAHAFRAVLEAMARPGKLFHSSGLATLCCWNKIGENVAYAGSAAQASQTLFNSAPHRANILNSSYDEVGVAVVQSGSQVWVTEVFRDRR